MNIWKQNHEHLETKLQYTVPTTQVLLEGNFQKQKNKYKA